MSEPTMKVQSFAIEEYDTEMVDKACQYALNTVRYCINMRDENGGKVSNMPSAAVAKILMHHMADAFAATYSPMDCLDIPAQATQSIVSYMRQICPDEELDEFAKVLEPVTYMIVTALCESCSREGGRKGAVACWKGVRAALESRELKPTH